MSEASDIIQRARNAAYAAFPFRNAYNDDDLRPSADAALRAVLEVLVNPPWGSAEIYAAEMLEALDTGTGTATVMQPLLVGDTIRLTGFPGMEGEWAIEDYDPTTGAYQLGPSSRNRNLSLPRNLTNRIES